MLESLEWELAEMGEGAELGAGLVVVDSVAAPVRREFRTSSGREWAELAATLGGVTTRLKCVCVCLFVCCVRERVGCVGRHLREQRRKGN